MSAFYSTRPLVNVIGSRITEIGTITASALACFWGAIFVVPAYFLLERGSIDMPVLSFQMWGCVAVLGIGVNAISTLLFLWTAKKAGASFVSYVGFIIPCVALGMGVFAGETITFTKALSLCLIVMGLVFLRPSFSGREVDAKGNKDYS